MLKPCPFCGCEAVLVNEFFDDYLVMCSNSGCATEGPLKATSDEAETAWNTRPAEVVEALKHMIELVEQYHAWQGDCDHAAGICMCGEKAWLDEARKALAAVGGE